MHSSAINFQIAQLLASLEGRVDALEAKLAAMEAREREREGMARLAIEKLKAEGPMGLLKMAIGSQ